ncbi:MAG: hypothetical protein A2420_00750 [Candidatus Moranbacteria bacterium RIFOXYC1_FULL_44_13]|nr:MAG: hypothetical protein A2184_03875 [Candidatus Moranbacteria bacterium RIFOXYA1_FULL_44_7]OGI32673.1 MAG: hypothetical protein A2420_00750 [Candidatus Moranbacteria bacterium RIFOXYC1_FULL_44_13]OGI37096.1 MAG: hypothetical protein A2612_04670 [Candidatus Moranbacteria bacterium RIFOXYD1_FULL_44_12]
MFTQSNNPPWADCRCAVFDGVNNGGFQAVHTCYWWAVFRFKTLSYNFEIPNKFKFLKSKIKNVLVILILNLGIV